MSPLLIALALTAGDLGEGLFVADGGLSAAPRERADVAFLPGSARALAVWVDDRRDLQFEGDRWRGPDLWAATWLGTNALQERVGRIICPTSDAQVFSRPRVVSSDAGVWIAWASSQTQSDEVRLATIGAQNTSAGCGAPVMAVDAGALLWLDLATSGGEVMAVVEVPEHVDGLFLSGGAPELVRLKDKPAGGPPLNPIVGPGPTPGSFFVGWREGGNAANFTELVVARNAGGATVGPPELQFTTHRLLSPPAFASRRPRVAFVGEPAIGGPTSLFEAPPDPLLLGGVLANTGQSALPHAPLVERGATSTQIVFARDGGWALAEIFALANPTVTGLRQDVPVALTMDANDRLLLLSAGNGELQLSPIEPGVVAPPIVSTSSAPSELRHSVVWTATGRFAVVYNTPEGGAVLFLDGERPAGMQGSPLPDGGVYRVLQRPDGVGIAGTLRSPTETRLFVPSATLGDITSTQVLRIGEPGFDGALMGNSVGVVWKIGGDKLAYGADPTGVQLSNYELGRCGGAIDGKLLVPAVVSGTELKLVVVRDDGTPGHDTLWLRSVSEGLRDPCLSLNGRELLVTATARDGKLLLFRTDWDSATRQLEARAVPVPSIAGAISVRSPVAAPVPTGWQLAWEVVGATGSAIRGLKLTFEDTSWDVGSLTGTLQSFDERRPVLAARPQGDVLLAWQRYVDLDGKVAVRTRLLPQLSRTDAGVPDAGQVDGGGELDGGLRDAGMMVESDGGLPAELVFVPGCGCGATPGTTLLGLGLLVLAARRRRG